MSTPQEGSWQLHIPREKHSLGRKTVLKKRSTLTLKDTVVNLLRLVVLFIVSAETTPAYISPEISIFWKKSLRQQNRIVLLHIGLRVSFGYQICSKNQRRLASRRSEPTTNERYR